MKFANKKGSPKRTEIKKIIADHKVKGKKLIEMSNKLDARKGKAPKPKESIKSNKRSHVVNYLRISLPIMQKLF